MIYNFGDNRLVSGSPESDPARDKLRKEAGLMKPDESLGIAQEGGVVKWYDISGVDIFGRMLKLSKNLSRSFERLAADEVEQALTYAGKTLSFYVTPEVLLDMWVALGAIGAYFGKPLPLSDPKGEKEIQQIKKWTASAMAQTAVPFYSFWKEQRKANDPRNLMMGAGREALPIEEWYVHHTIAEEDKKHISEMEKGVGVLEMFVNELKSLTGKSEEVPSRPNMWGEAVLPAHNAELMELSYEVPGFISVLFESIEEKAANIPGLHHLVPAIEGQVTNTWRGLDYRIGYDEQWLGEGGLADTVMSPDRRQKIEELAENIVKVTEREHPNLIKSPRDRERKRMQARVYLELEALRAADTKLTGEESTITSLVPSDRITYKGLRYSNVRDTVTLHPKDYNRYLEIMNDDGTPFNSFSDDEIEHFGRDNFNKYKSSYLKAMYETISTNYNGRLGAELLTPQMMFDSLRRIQRHYSEMARVLLRRENSHLFNELESKLDEDRETEFSIVRPL